MHEVHGLNPGAGIQIYFQIYLFEFQTTGTHFAQEWTMQKGQCKKEGKQGPSPPFEYIVYPTIYPLPYGINLVVLIKEGKEVDTPRVKGLFIYITVKIILL